MTIAATEYPTAVTPWRSELAARQSEIAEFILTHADPEEAMRLAQDIAHDLADAVKQQLRARHGRTFDSLLDYEPPPATYRFKPDPVTERILSAIAECPGITHRELAARRGLGNGGRSSGSLGILLPMLFRTRQIRREGSGSPGNVFRYYPSESTETKP